MTEELIVTTLTCKKGCKRTFVGIIPPPDNFCEKDGTAISISRVTFVPKGSEIARVKEIWEEVQQRHAGDILSAEDAALQYSSVMVSFYKELKKLSGESK